MMQDCQAVGEETKGGRGLQHIENTCSVMQKESTIAESGLPNLSRASVYRLDDVPEDALGRCRLECSQNTLDLDSGKAVGLTEMLEGSASSSHGLDLVQDEGSKNLELDKNLPPIKTRREGDSREHSPSDLSPPSPKRLRQGSKETQEKWNGLFEM